MEDNGFVPNLENPEVNAPVEETPSMDIGESVHERPGADRISSGGEGMVFLRERSLSGDLIIDEEVGGLDVVDTGNSTNEGLIREVNIGNNIGSSISKHELADNSASEPVRSSIESTEGIARLNETESGDLAGSTVEAVELEGEFVESINDVNLNVSVVESINGIESNENTAESINAVVVPREEIIAIVDRELVSARTALAGYAAEIVMLEAGRSRSQEREQYLLTAPSGRLDELARSDETQSAVYQSDRAAAMSSMAALIRELRALIDLCKNGLTQADLEKVMREFIKRRRSIETTPDRLVGVLRLAGNLRVRKEVGIDVARGFIREIENLTRQRRLISNEIDIVSRSIERERRLVPTLEALRTEFELKLDEFERRLAGERRRLQAVVDFAEAGPSHVTPAVPVVTPVSVNRSTRQWQHMTREQRIVKRSKTREKKAEEQSKRSFKYYGRGAVTHLAPEQIMRLMKKLHVTPARRFTTMHHYITVNRRLILRNIGEVVERNGDFEVVERAMLNSIERFWLCITRWQHLQTKENREGVTGARRGTRIRDIAADLQVPGELAGIYRHARGGDYLWYPPATLDLRVAERESNHRYRESNTGF